MIVDLHPNIQEIENRYKQLKLDLTQTCLEVEKTCEHKVWCGQDWRSSDYGNSFDGIYICLNCRMEVHVPYADYTGYQKPPTDCLVLSTNQCRVDNIFSLRISGDDRGHLHKEHSSSAGWPVRPETVQEELENV